MPHALPKDTRDKILTKAIAWFQPIEREMELMKWTPEQREYMWGSIVSFALDRQIKAQGRSGSPESGRGPAGAGLDVGSGDSELQRSSPADRET
jgi:hypothetical protein